MENEKNKIISIYQEYLTRFNLQDTEQNRAQFSFFVKRQFGFSNFNQSYEFVEKIVETNRECSALKKQIEELTKKKSSKNIVNDIKRLLKARYTYDEIASRLNISKSTVYRVNKQYGIRGKHKND